MRSHQRLVSMIIGASVLCFSAITIAAITSGTSTTGISGNETYVLLTINKPSDTAVGDILLASIAVDGGMPATTTPPSGWNLIQRIDNDTNVSLISYWKEVGPSEPSSYTWTITETRAVGGITRYAGIDTSNPIDAATSTTGRGTTATAPSVTTTVSNSQVVALFAINAATTSSATFSAPSGMTLKYARKNAPLGPTIAASDKTQTSIGASGTAGTTVSSGPPRDWAAQQIALRPEPSGITIVASGVDNSGVNFGQSGSFSLNCNAGTLLVVSLAGYNDSTVASLTYGGISLTQATRYVAPGNTAHADIWYLKNPASGTNTLSWAWSTATYDLSSIGWICTTGEAASPIGPNTNGATGGGNSSPLTVLITTTANNSLIYSSGWEGGGDQSGMVASGANTTLAYAFQNTSVETVMGVYQTTTAAGSYTSGAVWPSDNVGHMAWIEILPQ